MHKSKNLIVISLLSIYLFSSCEFLNFVLDDLEEEKKNSSVKTTQISIDEKDNGKEGYIVYYNKGDATGYLGRTAVSNKSEMTIYKSVFRMENGLYRDDVQFTVDDNTIRKVSREVGAKNNIYRDLKDDKFYVATKSNANTMESLELKKFILKETGQHCRIWYLNNSSIIDDSIVTDEELQKLADTVDRIFKEETSIFGSNYIKDKPYMITADENTQIDVLVYDIYGDANQKQKDGTFGFFNPNELYTNITNSNECEAIHIDSYFLQLDIIGIKNKQGTFERTHTIDSTIVHEFQHLLNYCNKQEHNLIWYNEMLSMCAEDVFQNVLNLSDYDISKSRLNESFDAPWNGFGIWPDNNDKPAIFYAYANAYAFGSYLMRNYGGVKLIQEIASNPSSGKDSITNALKSLGYQESFDSVLEKFGRIYILNPNNSISLNKSISQKIDGITYTLDPIKLENNYFHYYSSKTERENAKQYLKLFGGEAEGPLDNGDYVYIFYGPRVFKNNYNFTEPIKTYGFVVYYLGKLDSSKTYSVQAPGENIEMSIVVID